MSSKKSVPAISVNYAHTGKTSQTNEFGMRPMQERVYEKAWRAVPPDQIATSLRQEPGR